jgi:5-methylcytosine-specific restriction endonuclease McrA
MANRPRSANPRRYRGSSSDQGYGAAWRRLRAQVLTEEPLCRGYQRQCSNPSTEVDHITPLRLGGATVRENLQALCLECHHAKTADQNGWGVGGRKISTISRLDVSTSLGKHAMSKFQTGERFLP